MTDYSGQSIGRYHIISHLGEGGMAVVYQAFDTRLECDVAVKFIRMERLSPEVSAVALKRFEREAKAVAQLTHPFIVKVTDYGEYRGVPYLVMPYLPGGTLKQLTGRPLPYHDAARLLVPLARALEYAHQHKVLHRDVKPSNILITQDGQPMLTDFGVAKLLENEEGQTLTGTGVGIGTPGYMAPEQALGQPVDGRADVYSLGIVFYELITGRKPYQADTPMAIIFKQMSDPLPSPDQYVPRLPDEVKNTLAKALAKRPEDRYANMSELASSLEKLSASEGNLSFIHINNFIEKEKAKSSYLSEKKLQIVKKPGKSSLKISRRNFVIGGATLAGGIVVAGSTLWYLNQRNTFHSSQSKNSPTLVSNRQTTPSYQSPNVANTNESRKIITTANVTKIKEMQRWTKGEIKQVVYSADGKYFLAVNSAGLRFFDRQTAKEVIAVNITDTLPNNIAISTDNQWVAVAGPISGGISIVNAKDGHFVKNIELQKGSWITDLEFSPDSKNLGIGLSNGMISLWSMEDNAFLQTILCGDYSVLDIAFSVDGQYLAEGSNTNTVNLWQTIDGKLFRSLNNSPSSVQSLAFSPDGKNLAGGSIDGILYLWQYSTGKLSYTIKAHQAAIVDMAFSPKGDFLVTNSKDNTTRFWNVETGMLLFKIQQKNAFPNSVAFSPDGQQIAFSSSDGILRIWGLSSN